VDAGRYAAFERRRATIRLITAIAGRRGSEEPHVCSMGALLWGMALLHPQKIFRGLSTTLLRSEMEADAVWARLCFPSRRWNSTPGRRGLRQNEKVRLQVISHAEGTADFSDISCLGRLEDGKELGMVGKRFKVVGKPKSPSKYFVTIKAGEALIESQDYQPLK
jgi:hypothetical protein